MSDFDPKAYLAEKTPEQAAPAASPAAASFDPEKYLGEKGVPLAKYETLPQQALTAAEGIGRGATLGLSDQAIVGSGLEDPEEMRARAAANPKIAGLSQIAGGAGLIAGTGGIAGPITGALGGGALATAAGYGLEGALMGAGNAVSDHALGDPNLNAQKVASEIGMGALFGIGAGFAGKGISSMLGKSGRLSGSVSDVVENESAGSAAKAETREAFSGFKENTPDILKAGEELGAPVTEGMVTNDPWIKKAEDALVNGAPTYSGIRKARLYEDGYAAVNKNLTDIVGEPDSDGGLSKAQLGGALEQSLTSKISESEKPISDLYNEVRSYTKDVPVSPRSLPRITQNIMDLDAVRLDPDGAAGSLAKRMAKNIENINSVDDIKGLRKILNDSVGPVASPSEKYVISQISDRLKELEKNTVSRYAEGITSAHEERLANIPAGQQLEENAIWGPKIEALKSLTSNMKEADRLYAPFIGKVKQLAKMFGKKNISGAQGAINFLTEEISPEQIAQRAFQKGNSETAEFFAKNFPEEWEMVKQYQKSALRDGAISDRSGQLNPRAFIKNVDKLEPEIKKLLFNTDELKKIDAARTYLRAIPEKFNPSGTSGMSAFREFFNEPAGAAMSNIRDFGIDAYIKAMGRIPPALRPNAVETGSVLAQKFNQFNAVRSLAEKAEMKMDQAAKSIFSGNAARGAIEAGGVQLGGSYDEKVRRINELASNAGVLGQHLANHVEAIDKTMPNFSQSVQYSITASSQFLYSKIPRPASHFMLSGPWEPSAKQKQEFNKYYDVVNNPLDILKQVKTGSVTHESLEAVQATHPDLLNEMRTQVLKEMSPENTKGLSYRVKMSLAKFLGQPLDSSMLPSVIISNQLALNGPPSPNGMSPKNQRSTQSGLAKLKIANRAATGTQSLEESGDN